MPPFLVDFLFYMLYHPLGNISANELQFLLGMVGQHFPQFFRKHACPTCIVEHYQWLFRFGSLLIRQTGLQE